MQISSYVSVDGYTAIASVPKGSVAWGKANSVFCPLGPAPTTAYILLVGRDVRSLDSNKQHTITFSQKKIPGGDITTCRFKGLWLVNAERVSLGGVGDPNALFLVEFRDSRNLAANHSETGDIRSNIRLRPRRSDKGSDFLDGTSLNDWDDFLEQVWNACLFLGEYPGLPSELPIDGVANDLLFIGNNAYQTLNTVLDVLDCAIRHNPFNDSYEIVQLGSDEGDSDFPNDPILQWDGETVTSQANNVAANLKIYHPVFHPIGQEKDTEFNSNWATSFTNPTLLPTGVSGARGTVALWDDLPKILNDTGGVTNQQELDQRDQNRLQRYKTRWNIDKQHKVLVGFVTDILPGPFIKGVVWRNLDDAGSNVLGGIVTEYFVGPNLLKSYQRDSQSYVECEAWKPMDINRNSYPVWPRIVNMVQVHHDQGEVGSEVSPDAQGTQSSGVKYHLGRVVRWNNQQVEKYDTCWILFLDNFDNKKGDVKAKQDEYYGPARLCGSSPGTFIFDDEQEEFLLPVYTVRSGAVDNKIVVFKLQEALSMGVNASANAKTCRLVANAYDDTGGESIVVVDGLSSVFGRWSGPIGALGIASIRPDGKYEIIEMQRNALIIEFTTTSNRDKGDPDFFVQIDNQFQQGDLRIQGNGSPTVKVYDESFRFPRIPKGAKGRAIWNDKANRYEIIECQQMCFRATARFSSTGQDGFMSGDIQYEPIENFKPINFSPFSLPPDPVPTEALNSYGWRCTSGDDLILFWDEEQEEWIVEQVPNQERGFIVKPTSTIEKGSAGQVTIVYGGVPGRTFQAIADGDECEADKLCSTWRDPCTGRHHVAPWEP